ncbi:hypothetical protein BpHYR1_014598 [Brachionus plicatilis]|uniref:Uncharacterized protein n=1 Tax=Brachionus plicatilis TaxID=10195 RepID=A0A3M7PV38_BRAPC|nr:hypothetical protein BpHYR1_014598 [Brachionus plicatilis]
MKQYPTYVLISSDHNYSNSGLKFEIYHIYDSRRPKAFQPKLRHHEFYKKNNKQNNNEKKDKIYSLTHSMFQLNPTSVNTLQFS